MYKIKIAFKSLLLITLLLIAANCQSTLRKAAYSGDIALAKQALEKGDQLTGESSLALNAAEFGHSDFLEFLKSNGYNLKEVDQKSGRTALHTAASVPGLKSATMDLYEKKIQTVTYLLQNGLDANATDQIGATPLSLAVGADIIDAVMRHKKNMAALREKRNFLQQSHVRSDDSVKELIELEKKVENDRVKAATDFEKVNNLNLPIDRMVSVLIKAKANPNLTSETIYNLTALHLAVLRKSEETVQTLIKAKAEVNAQDTLGETPLHYSATRSQDIYNTLVKAKANIRLQNQNRLTPYDMATWRINVWQAASTGDVSSIDEYTKSGGSVDAYGEFGGAWGWTPLHVAAYAGNKEAANALLKNKADVNAIFHPAGEMKKVSFPFSLKNLNPVGALEALTRGGVSISSPMFFADRNEKPEMVELLASRGGKKELSIPELHELVRNTSQKKIWGYGAKK